MGTPRKVARCLAGGLRVACRKQQVDMILELYEPDRGEKLEGVGERRANTLAAVNRIGTP